jgi:hypothetical protein
MLEPDAVKAARAVLRGGRGNNPTSLPDHALYFLKSRLPFELIE